MANSSGIWTALSQIVSFFFNITLPEIIFWIIHYWFVILLPFQGVIVAFVARIPLTAACEVNQTSVPLEMWAIEGLPKKIWEWTKLILGNISWEINEHWENILCGVSPLSETLTSRIWSLQENLCSRTLDRLWQMMFMLRNIHLTLECIAKKLNWNFFIKMCCLKCICWMTKLKIYSLRRAVWNYSNLNYHRKWNFNGMF